MRRAATTASAVVAAYVAGRSAGAQAPPERVTRTEAVARAVARGPRLAIARADSLAAKARLGLARQFENPILALGYSKDVPQQHVGLDVPIDLPWLRGPRIASAAAGLAAARLRVVFAQKAVAYEVDTAYTGSLSLAGRARLSRRTALDADSLLVIARIRRDAGDVSELDVQLASLNAGQLANTAAADSLEALSALLGVQALMGLPAESPGVVLVDTLAPPAASTMGSGTASLIAAAEEDVRSAEQLIALERRRLFSPPSLTMGFSTRDPGGTGNEILPNVGIALPIPLFNQNAPSILAAQAERDRATAELARLRIEIGAALARARREAVARRDRATRSRQLVDGATRVAALALLAYREGAASLASVLEAQRSAREAQSQYLTDVANALNAAGLVALLETSASDSTAPTRRNSP